MTKKKILPCREKIILLQHCISITMQKVSIYNSLIITPPAN